MKRINNFFLASFIFLYLGCTANKLEAGLSILILYHPEYGTLNPIKGKVSNPSRNLFLYGFFFHPGIGWNKMSSNPIKIINSEFEAIPSNKNEYKFYTRAVFFLLKDELSLDEENFECLPNELYKSSIAYKEIFLEQPSIVFSGYEWMIKESNLPVGPRENIFTSNNNSIWKDDEGRLHLKINKLEGIWKSVELGLSESLGYGEYIWRIDSDISKLNQNTVLGFFTWDEDGCSKYFNEIDFEFSKWGNGNSRLNAQTVVQPQNPKKFSITADSPTTHTIKWEKEKITFRSFDHLTGDLLAEKIFSDNIPIPNNEKFTINLWILEKDKPSADEIIIGNFKFIPINEK